jgi:hypothetical protein
VPTVCAPDPSHHTCVRPYHDTANRNAGGPHDHRDAVLDINGGKMDGFIIQARSGRHLACVANVDTARLLARAADAGRDGLPRRARAAELLVVGAELRAPGPHVPVGHVVEPARPPLHGLWLVGEVREARRSDELPPRGAGAGIAAGQSAEPDRRDSDYAWTDLTYLLHTGSRQLELLRVPRRAA